MSAAARAAEETGVANCRQFAPMLNEKARELGADFRFNTTVAQLPRAYSAPLLVAVEMLPRRFDQVVICTCLAFAGLLKSLGLSIALTTVHGFTLSARRFVKHGMHECSPWVDERFKLAISRMGNRVRVAGSAEVGGSPAYKRDASVNVLRKVLEDWFPGPAQLTLPLATYR